MAMSGRAKRSLRESVGAEAVAGIASDVGEAVSDGVAEGLADGAGIGSKKAKAKTKGIFKMDSMSALISGGAFMGIAKSIMHAVDAFETLKTARESDARAMGGDAKKIGDVIQSMDAIDKHVGWAAGSSQALWASMRDDLGMSGDQATALLHKFQQLTKGEMGASGALDMANAYITLQRQLMETGKGATFTREQLAKMAGNNENRRKILEMATALGISEGQAIDATQALKLMGGTIDKFDTGKLKPPEDFIPWYQSLFNYTGAALSTLPANISFLVGEIMDAWKPVGTWASSFFTQQFGQLKAGFNMFVKPLVDSAMQLGTDMLTGFFRTFNIIPGATDMMTAAVAAMRHAVGAHSPADATIALGQDLGDGLSAGLSPTVDAVGTAFSQMVPPAQSSGGVNVTQHMSFSATNHIQSGADASGSEFGEQYAGVIPGAVSQIFRRAAHAMGA